MSDKLQVLILCTANSARSQMGEGLLRRLAADKIDAFSAGSRPAKVNPFAIQAMRERGIDISAQASDHLERYLKKEFDYVITVCDRAAESCPVFPGKAERVHWGLPDPSAVDGGEREILKSFIAVRDDLEARLAQWLETLP